jgi:hypothetical protein
MTKKLVTTAIVVAALLAVITVASADRADAEPAGPTAFSSLGLANIQGEQIIVDVIVAVQPGQNPAEVGRAALRAQGARPFDSAKLGSQGFTLTGLVWDNLPVVQNYNPANEPASLDGDGLSSLTGTHAAWDGVASSFFDIDSGGLTGRCPSLVKECPGPQVFDSFNDVGWARLDRRTLGVTWYGTSSHETDMALNIRFNWSDSCTDESGSFDVETVFLHENGHVLGLGHSNDVNAIMYPSYQEARCSLHQDDEEGATFLYPAQTAAVSGTVTDSGGPISGATVALQGTQLSAQTDANGQYAITGVPYPVTYDISASANDHETSAVRERVDQDPETVDFSLAPSGGGDSDGGGPPACVPKRFCQ